MFSLFIIVILTVINLTRPEINYYLICHANKKKCVKNTLHLSFARPKQMHMIARSTSSKTR